MTARLYLHTNMCLEAGWLQWQQLPHVCAVWLLDGSCCCEQWLLPLLSLPLPPHMQDDSSHITTQLKGLAVKAQSRLLEDAAGGTPGPTDSIDGPTSSSSSYRPRLAQEVATSILEPCDVRLVLKGSAAVQDVALEVSALQLRMSPDVMQLLLHLHKVRSGCAASDHWQRNRVRSAPPLPKTSQTCSNFPAGIW